MSFSSGRNISNNVNTDEAQTLTNKTIDSANNSLVVDADTATVSNIEADNLKAGVIDNDLSSTSVNDDTVPSAKAAKAYTDAAASTASSNLTTHETSTTGVHGVTGDIVGTSDTQTLTNKTITGADIRTPARADVKQDTRANLDVYATTAADGQTVYATDEKKYYGIVDNALVALGGGLGSPQTVSVIQADDLQTASDFSGQNADLVTGGVATNGTLDGTLSLSSTASELLTGVDDVIKYVASTSSQYDYFGHTHAIPQGFAGRTLAVELTYRTASGYSNGDMSVEILSDNGTTVSYLNNKINLLNAKESADGNGKTVRFLVNVPSDCESLKVAFQNLSTTSGITFFVDKISVDIDDFNYKNLEVTTEWVDNGPVVIEASTTNPTKGTTVKDNLYWRRVGDSMQIKVQYRQTSAGTSGSGFYRFKLPDGYEIDDTKTGIGNIFQNNCGSGSALSSGQTQVVLTAFPVTSTAIGMWGLNEQNRVNIEGTGGYHLGYSEVRYTFTCTVPIKGWSANSKHVVVDSGDAETEVYRAYRAAGYGSPTNTAIPYFGTEAENTSNKLFSVENSSANGFSVTALQDIEIDFTYNAMFTTTVGFGISKNSTQLGTAIDSITSSDVVTYGSTSAANKGQSISFNGVLKAGDTLRPHTNKNSFNLSDVTNSVNISARKADLGEYHLVPVTDQENVFSARIANNGTASIDAQNMPWIDSVSRTSAGKVVVDFTSLGLTAAPSYSVTSLRDSDGGTTAWVRNVSATSIEVHTNIASSNTLTDFDFSIKIQKQGADYKEPRAYIGSVAPTLTAYIKDVKSSGTYGGAFTSGSFITRDLNQLEGDTSFISLSSNQFTLGAGKYEIEARAPAHMVDEHKSLLYNVTDATNQIIGSSNFAQDIYNVTNNSFIHGSFTISSSKTFEIRHRCSKSKTVDGLGVANSYGVDEVYTVVKIKKVK